MHAALMSNQNPSVSASTFLYLSIIMYLPILCCYSRHLLKKIEARELTEEDINPKANGITNNKQSMTDIVPDKQV